MKIGNRILAFVLAGLMLMGIVGSLFSIFAEAADFPTMSYRINKVYKGASTVYDAAAGTGTPEIGSSSSRSGYTADITVTIIDPYTTKAAFDALASPTVSLQGGSLSKGNSFTYTIKNVQDYSGGVKYDIVMTDIKYSGNGNRLEVVVESTSPSYDCVVMTSVSECISYRDDDDDDDEYSDLAVATPYVIVSKYTYGSGQITAGDTFNLTLTFYNTSIAVDVSNMMVTVAMPDDLMLTSSSNTFYIDYLERDTAVTKTVQVKAKPAAKPQSHNISVSMKYQYIDHRQNVRKDNTTEETIAIPVIQLDRFQATGIEMDPQLIVGEETYLALNYVNKGRSEVYNISVEITGNIQNPGQIQNMGNLASGATGSVDFYVIPAEAGLCSGEVIITYEDTNMQERTITVPFSGEAIDYSDMWGGKDPGYPPYPGFEDPSMIPEEKKPVWPFIVGAVVVIAIPTGIIVKKKIDKKRSDALDAEL